MSVTSAPELVLLAGALLLAGGLTGMLAGLFGVGGGAVIVPVLYQAFVAVGVADDVRMPLTVGTSLGVIVPMSIVSYLAHRKTGAIDRDILGLWAWPCAAGVALGAGMAALASPLLFKLVFVVVAGGNGIKLLLGPARATERTAGPGAAAMRGIGLLIGLISALMGISGGMVSNVILLHLGRSIRQAVATSAALGLWISIPGAIGYALAGMTRAPALPPFSIGFVSLPALVLVSVLGMLLAPAGARLAHSIDRRHLEIAFGCYLLAASTRFAIDLASR